MLTVVLIIIWPLLSVPAGVFTESYFAFWVFIAIAWGFSAGIVITVLPLTESSEEIGKVWNGMLNYFKGDKGGAEEEVPAKELEEEEPAKE